MTVSTWQLPKKQSPFTKSDLLDCTEVPSHQKIPFILCGYRPAPQSKLSLLQTMFTLHNETGNMWTHLVGAVYFSAVGLQFYQQIWGGEQRAWTPEQAWLLLLIIATDFCLVCSVSYHLCKCGQQHTYECTLRMDMSGIVALVAVSYFAGVALAFRCFPSLRAAYLLYSGGVAVGISIPLVKPQLIPDVTRHFIGCVALGLIPAIHWISLSDPADLAVAVPYLVAMFACYGIGAFFYIQKWPERRWPGRFDFIGHSHQLWHIFVLLAAFSWVQGGFAMLEKFGADHCPKIE